VRRLAFAVVALALPFSFAACDSDPVQTTPGSETDTYEPNDPGGVGMTYNGKLGYDYGGGFVQPFDGSAPGLGFGF